MQELLGRIARLDPSASMGLRVIACFDELMVGHVNTRALLSAAASLAGCIAGFTDDHSGRTMRVTPRGQLTDVPAAGVPCAETATTGHDGLRVWLEREGTEQANDAIILERLALSVRLRHGRAHADLDARRDLGVLVGQTGSEEERRVAAAAIGLTAGRRYRVVTAPLFAVWRDHPSGPEDVIPTPFGPIHALVLPEELAEVDASPCGIGLAEEIGQLHHSFRTAMVALRLCGDGRAQVTADEFGGLVSLLADATIDSPQPDADRLEEVVAHPWGLATVDAVVRSPSVRQAARLAGVHHSTLQNRLDCINQEMGFDPYDGFGRTRLGTAYLIWRLRHSRVLDLPVPAPTKA